MTTEPTPTAPAGLTLEEREARLADGADELAKGHRSLQSHPQLLVGVAAALMTTGLSIIVLGWFGAARSTIVEEQIPYLISGGLLGVALATIGALTLFAHWLTVLVRENRRQETVRKQEHVELMEALAQLTAALDRKEGTNARARSAQPERAVRRASSRP
ncbi:MAG: hypothetical protein ACJ739_15085 [Acidimicrobiales bacterium]